MNRFVAFLKWAFSYDIVRYVTVGAANTVAIFGLFFLFNDLIGTGPIWANRIGYFGGLICNFVLNKIWTFRSHSFSFVEIILFLISFAISYSIQFVIFRVAMDDFGWGEGTAAFLAYPLYGVAFYILSKFLAFNPKVTMRFSRNPGEIVAGSSSENQEAV